MEDKAFRRGLSVAAIVLIVISAVLLTLTNTNGLLYGSEAVLYGVPFVAAAALPLLAVLLILTQFYTKTKHHPKIAYLTAIAPSISSMVSVLV